MQLYCAFCWLNLKNGISVQTQEGRSLYSHLSSGEFFYSRKQYEKEILFQVIFKKKPDQNLMYKGNIYRCTDCLSPLCTLCPSTGTNDSFTLSYRLHSQLRAFESIRDASLNEVLTSTWGWSSLVVDLGERGIDSDPRVNSPSGQSLLRALC